MPQTSYPPSVIGKQWNSGSGTTTAVGGGQPPTSGTKGAAAPGNVFANEPTITAQNPTNAAKLAGLGFVANPQTAWTSGQGITILPTYHFSWDGTQWQFDVVETIQLVGVQHS